MAHNQFLDCVTVAELLQGKQPLVQVLSTDTVEHCLELFKTHKVLSLPVGSHQRGAYVGIIDLLDIMVYVAFASYFNSGGKLQVTEQDFTKFTNLHKPIANLIGMAEESKRVTVVDQNTKIQELMDLFSWGAHRVLAIMQSHVGDTVTMLTQTDVLNFLLQNKDKLSPKVGQTVESLGLGKNQVVALKSNLTAVEAFRVLAQNRARAMPIVDNTGIVIANLSCSDLRGITQETLKNVTHPVMDYLSFVHEGSIPAPVTCEPKNSFAGGDETSCSEQNSSSLGC